MNKISKEKFDELLSISGLPLENPEILENNDIEMIDFGEDIDNIPKKQTEYKDLWRVEETSDGKFNAYKVTEKNIDYVIAKLLGVI